MEILDYNVIKNNNFDRTKSYFSRYYKSIILIEQIIYILALNVVRVYKGAAIHEHKSEKEL